MSNSSLFCSPRTFA